jgi:RND superfamily putative drug exporter
MLRALVETGPVITSAGVILAGTFGVLMVLPIWELLELGFAVALGVLIDTFLVRSVLVPSIVWIVGERCWWPSSAQSGGRAPVTGAFRIMPRESVEQ